MYVWGVVPLPRKTIVSAFPLNVAWDATDKLESSVVIPDTSRVLLKVVAPVTPNVLPRVVSPVTPRI